MTEQEKRSQELIHKEEELYTLNLGPTHPATHGVFRMVLTVDGEVVVDEQERRWMLQPVGPWTQGPHFLVVATTIEDLAGNNIGKTFDVELAAGTPRQVAAPSVAVPFEVR